MEKSYNLLMKLGTDDYCFLTEILEMLGSKIDLEDISTYDLNRVISWLKVLGPKEFPTCLLYYYYYYYYTAGIAGATRPTRQTGFPNHVVIPSRRTEFVGTRNSFATVLTLVTAYTYKNARARGLIKRRESVLWMSCLRRDAPVTDRREVR